ncbi:peptide-methionine (S)-S-oxide reductase MsrA [Sulfuriferula nivalis]|uniref:Peptide methionine sulfoxide reductase MsrA n=1 Tax=Sulfuriferula nivalis TaxID=2675298 RepID=A0A809RSE7_9PROT|nr:peptide-methionine (S)-S-oxide reductase MsrA [Sulfuriferula nivalis]BBP01801.1 peptide methionine sulfoxide reductase MsrA [Sulfuriferula nivalis]
MSTGNNHEISTVTLGGGCFWCLEAVFEKMHGVIRVVSGYMGGAQPDPVYEDVCTGTTGHAEVVQVTYDTQQTSLVDILHVFFTIHDATTLNRQGNDVGTQYRSVIFYYDEMQKKTSAEVLTQLQSKMDRPVVTELSPATEFYRAEEMHQHYFELHPQQGYCQYVVAPKVAKFQQHFPQWVEVRG